MAKRYDVCYAKEYDKDGETKTTFPRLGSAFENEEKGSIQVLLDSVPTTGLSKLMLFARTEDDDFPPKEEAPKRRR